MNQQELKRFLAQKKQLIEVYLSDTVKDLQTPQHLQEAMNYSLNAGGKRLRPILLLATLAAFNYDERYGLSTAAALEMIHTYSLIHDDLPAMDDDDLRRGKPTNHIVYGEAAAILAGDALLTYSFGLIANDPLLAADVKVRLISELVKAAGPEGMVAGQAADMEAEGKSLRAADLENIHKNKTGELLAFAVTAGAIIANATESQINSFREFALHLGLAFQIKDDILDIEGDETLLGKPVGSDLSNEKSTYPRLLTLEGAKQKCDYHINAAKAQLSNTGTDDKTLTAITNYIGLRTH